MLKHPIKRLAEGTRDLGAGIRNLHLIPPEATTIIMHPGAFALQVLRAFRANQGLLLAGAVAYYTLLSLVPLLILMVLALSRLIDQTVLLASLRRAMEWVVPGQSQALLGDATAFFTHGHAIGWVLLATVLFFSSLAFRVLESAISVIFTHCVTERKRRFMVSMMLPFGYIVFIVAALCVDNFVFANLLAVGRENVFILGYTWSLGTFTRLLVYLAGVTVEILLISSIYYFMPVNRISPRHALIGGATAGLLWEIIRHALAWYFSSLSQVSVVYGSLATGIIVLFSLDIAATLLLLGAQVIAEYESIGQAAAKGPPAVLHTGAPAPVARRKSA
jgi:YihY family inner membrane protein